MSATPDKISGTSGTRHLSFVLRAMSAIIPLHLLVICWLALPGEGKQTSTYFLTDGDGLGMLFTAGCTHDLPDSAVY